MKMSLAISLLGCATLLGACGEASDLPPSAEVEQEEDVPSVFEPLTEPLDRAAAVEAEGIERKSRADAELERMERGDDPGD